MGELFHQWVHHLMGGSDGIQEMGYLKEGPEGSAFGIVSCPRLLLLLLMASLCLLPIMKPAVSFHPRLPAVMSDLKAAQQ